MDRELMAAQWRYVAALAELRHANQDRDHFARRAMLKRNAMRAINDARRELRAIEDAEAVIVRMNEAFCGADALALAA